jgi:uroporphyrin-III C-methyltransferase
MKSRSTVVIYMGMKKLREIADTYLQEGLGEVPAAIIQHGSLPHQRMAVGVAAALPAMAAEYRLSHPAVILIGEVVGVGRGTGLPVAVGATGETHWGPADFTFPVSARQHRQ